MLPMTLRIWLMMLRDIMPEKDQKSCFASLKTALCEQKLGKRPGNQQTTPTSYYTAAWSRHPCTCRYRYGGFGEGHKVFQYGLGAAARLVLVCMPCCSQTISSFVRATAAAALLCLRSTPT